MSAPIKPPLAKKRCCVCANEAKGRSQYCPNCRRLRRNAKRAEAQRRKRAGESVPERLARVESLLAQLIALGRDVKAA